MLTLTDYSDTTPDVTATYDNFGRPVETNNTLSKSTYLYDPATLVLDTETVSHDINADGTPELTRVIDRSQDNLLRPTGYSLSGTTPASGVGGGAPPQPESATSYAYNPTTGRLETVSNPLAPGQVFPYAYTPGSDLIASVASPAHTVTNAWEATRNVLGSKENKAGATVVSAYGYTVNSLGQRTGVSQTGTAFAATRSIAWGYDPLGQVVKADSTIPGLDRAYQYDLIGNRIKSADSLTLPAAPNYTTNALNQYSSIQNPQSAIINPAYDADGNATAYPLPANLSANSTLTWDAENRMISSTVGTTTTTTTYQYDAGSRRIAQTTGTNTTVYIYDGWNPIAEYSSPNLQSPISHVRSFLWGVDLSGSMQGAGGVGGLLSVSEISNSQISNYFPTYDGNGNVSEYLDSTGAVVAHYEYDPFGKTTVATGSKAQDFSHRFSTKPLDPTTGLYYYGYRYYDPATGRWPSRDPIEEQGGVNLYGFIGNDGINRWDFLGLKWIQVDGSFKWTKPLKISNVKLEFNNAGNGAMEFKVAKITWKGTATVTCECDKNGETRQASGGLTATGQATSADSLMFTTNPGPPMGPITGIGDALASLIEAGLGSLFPPGMRDPGNVRHDVINLIEDAQPGRPYWDANKFNPCQVLNGSK